MAEMGEMVEILNPVGKIQTERPALATRPRDIAGLRPGVLENQKQNARLLMESMIEGMRERIALGPLAVGSKTSSTPPRPRLITLLRENADFLLVGTND